MTYYYTHSLMYLTALLREAASYSRGQSTLRPSTGQYAEAKRPKLDICIIFILPRLRGLHGRRGG